MMTMRCVLLVSALCAWCACGCLALNELRIVEVSNIGGYAVMAEVVSVAKPDLPSCPSGGGKTGESCIVTYKESQAEKAVACTAEDQPSGCKTLKVLDACKEKKPLECQDSDGIVSVVTCTDEAVKNCTISKKVVPEREGSSTEGDGRDSLGPSGGNLNCPKVQGADNKQCVSEVAGSLQGATREGVEHSGPGAHVGGALEHRAEGEKDLGLNSAVDASCTSSPSESCGIQTGNRLNKGKEIVPQLQPQQPVENAEGGGELGRFGTNEGTGIEQTQRKKSGYGRVGGVDSKTANLSDEKNNKATIHADSTQGNSGGEISGGSESTNREELSSGVSPPAEHTSAGDSTPEDHYNTKRIPGSASHGEGEQTVTVEAPAPLIPSSPSASEATDSKSSTTAAAPEVENVKDTKNADSSVSLVWVHALLLLLTLFAVAAV
ncbi:hypothetical protein DQ04_12791000 [Trypanosoma grayi]|uniref:hypothetical protein n=1 Tax=Trypanosoma grayi TaxID=71804 RepID=UPI0004F48F6B|nr:hypothetical protein DQ04_12791000 [Trypanosoma grayi]KEG06675.1 hypothetical protein DQ04_12791000 [Trypanosoma grayi]